MNPPPDGQASGTATGTRSSRRRRWSQGSATLCRFVLPLILLTYKIREEIPCFYTYSRSDNATAPQVECVQEAGELLFVPTNWCAAQLRRHQLWPGRLCPVAFVRLVTSVFSPSK